MISFFDYKKVYSSYRAEIEREIKSVIDSGRFINGDQVASFEKDLSSYLKSKHVISVSSGTDALLSIFMASGLKKNDKVLVTPFTYVASAAALCRAGLTPVFVDVASDQFYPTLEQVEKRYSSDIKAVLVVHVFGEPAETYPIKQFCDSNGIFLFEDCAQSLGSSFETGKQTGTVGAAGAFSFFPTKNLGCFGDGGAVCTDDEKLAHAIRVVKNQGCHKKYYPKVLGGNFRLDEIQAAVLRVMLNKLDMLLERRKNNAAFYLEELGHIEQLILPTNRPGHSWNQFTVRTKHRDKLKKHLDHNEIGSAIYYPCSLNSFPIFDQGDVMVNAEKLCSEVLSFPVYPNLSQAKKELVVHEIRKYFNV